LAAFSLSRTSDMNAAGSIMSVRAQGEEMQPVTPQAQCQAKLARQRSCQQEQARERHNTDPGIQPAPRGTVNSTIRMKTPHMRRTPASRRSSRAAPRSSRLTARCSLRRSDRSLRQQHRRSGVTRTHTVLASQARAPGRQAAVTGNEEGSCLASTNSI
jgi:hypothetical protein